MFATFFCQAARAPGRQRLFRRAVVAHILLLTALVVLLPLSPRGGVPLTLFGQFLVIAGIVEGAVLAGWRLTQLPKSQALEFLLVSPLRPFHAFLAEALVGVTLVALVTLSGLPLLALLVATGLLDPLDLFPFLLVPLTWGAVTGVLLATWAYEPLRWRKRGERVMMALVLLYLVCGVLAGEKLLQWLQELPESIGYPVYRSLIVLRDDNPFGAMRLWTEKGADLVWERMVRLELVSLGLLVLLALRAAWRLEPHFNELHYQPVMQRDNDESAKIADRPLTWWAVKRVSGYSGRINLWLAGGFGLLYALHAVAGPHWPAWMGASVFNLCDRVLGLAGLATALIVLAAVPAAFQYGLWDASIQDRCRRLELLLLSQLGPRDYWHAAALAAWKRGRGYFVVALVLLVAAALAGQVSADRAVAAIAAGVLLWALYFALGFRSFARGVHANGMGMLLTVGLPLAAAGLLHLGWTLPGSLFPSGAVYASAASSGVAWAAGPVFLALLTLWLTRQTLATCDLQLRRWYDQHHGRKVMS